jgi:flagellar basal-body rod modification protein FlgD
LNAETVLWGGVGSDGTPLESGSYTFEIESVNSGDVTSTKPVEHYALIREARLGSDGVEIVFAGGATVPSTDVRALRSPQAQL